MKRRNLCYAGLLRIRLLWFGCDGLRPSTTAYAQLGGIAFGLLVLTLSLRSEGTGRYVQRRCRCVSAGCNRRTARVATAHCRHDRDRVSVTMSILRRNTTIGLVTEGVTAVGSSEPA